MPVESAAGGLGEVDAAAEPGRAGSGGEVEGALISSIVLVSSWHSYPKGIRMEADGCAS